MGKKGYHVLNDILNENGDLRSRTEMEELKLKIYFLDYFELNHSIKKILQQNETFNKISGPSLPRIILEIGLNNKGCSKTYNTIMF